MGFSRQEYWSGLPCPPPGDLPNPGIEPVSLVCPALAGGFFTTEPALEFFFVYRQRDLFTNPLLACAISRTCWAAPRPCPPWARRPGEAWPPMRSCQERRSPCLPGGLTLPQAPPHTHTLGPLPDCPSQQAGPPLSWARPVHCLGVCVSR